jgi:hypothetical protein
MIVGGPYPNGQLQPGRWSFAVGMQPLPEGFGIKIFWRQQVPSTAIIFGGHVYPGLGIYPSQ